MTKDDELLVGTVPIHSPDFDEQVREANVILGVYPDGSKTVFCGGSYLQLIAGPARSH